jgi:hypothetical protein
MVTQSLIQSYQNCHLIQYQHKLDEFEQTHEFDDEGAAVL